MKRYRIISDGQKYRVQHRIKLFIFDFWRTDTFNEVSDNYPKVIRHPVEFESLEEAEDYVFDQLRQLDPKEERKKEKAWKTVRKYSDKHIPAN